MEPNLDDVTKDQFDLSCNPAKVVATADAADQVNGFCGIVKIQCGDVNTNGNVTTVDAHIALRMAVSLVLPSPLADVTSPYGSVFSSDALAIIQQSVGSSPPPSFCGAVGSNF